MLMKGDTEFNGILVRLAEALDIRQSSISDAKSRKSVPAEWLLKALEFGGVDPNWIRTGEGPKYRVLSDDPKGALTVTELTKRIVEEKRRPLCFEELLEILNDRLPDGACLKIEYLKTKSFTERYFEAHQAVAEQQESHDA